MSLCASGGEKECIHALRCGRRCEHVMMGDDGSITHRASAQSRACRSRGSSHVMSGNLSGCHNIESVARSERASGRSAVSNGARTEAAVRHPLEHHAHEGVPARAEQLHDVRVVQLSHAPDFGVHAFDALFVHLVPDDALRLGGWP